MNEFSWVDTFIANVRPYIFVRKEDNLLIKRPNSAFKLNPMGATILLALLQGSSIKKILKKIAGEAEKRRQLLDFLLAVKGQLEGKLDESNPGPAVEITPFNMKFSSLPVLSEVAITYRCNLSCRFCYAGCNCTTNPVQSDREMSKKQIKFLLKKIYHEARVPSVSFTGGEPTLRSDLPDLIAYAKKLGMRVNLITNGSTITREGARKLAKKGLDSAQVSLEGVSAQVHDRVVGHAGAFAKTIAAIGFLKETGIHTHTNTTINGLNLEDCSRMPQFVKEELGNDKFSMNLVIPSGSSSVNDDVLVRYSEMNGILSGIIKESERVGVEFMWYSPVPMCMFNSVARGLGNKGCSACDGLISLAANGDILPCSSFGDSLGNLLTGDFQDIWQSKKAVMYRSKDLAHQICKGCPEFSICNGACPLYWDHLGFDELFEYNKSTLKENKETMINDKITSQ